jgi:RNA-dependent RNA polymerase
MILEGLGVPYETFERHQDMAVEAAKSAKHSLGKAVGLMEGHGLGASFRLPSVLLNLERLGATLPPENSFYGRLLEYSINHVLRMIKHKGKILPC